MDSASSSTSTRPSQAALVEAEVEVEAYYKTGQVEAGVEAKA